MVSFDFKDKVVVITGGRRGIGLALSKAFALAGATVAIVAKSPQEMSCAGEHSADGNIRYFQIDLNDRVQRAGLLDRITAELGRIDILVNNAGIQSPAPLFDYGLERWDADLELMLTVVFDLSVQAARIMKGQGGGKIVNIASISSFQGARNIVGYATAKHGLVGLTKCLANELAGCGINVNGVAPGLVRTDMAHEVFNDPVKSAELAGRIPAGRFAEPEDIVVSVMFLASEGAGFIHGHVLLVDGGWMGR